MTQIKTLKITLTNFVVKLVIFFFNSLISNDVELAVKILVIKTNPVTLCQTYVRGTDLLYHYIVLLFNYMLVHCIVPENFRVSILVPIPKDQEKMYRIQITIVLQH